MQIVRRDDGSIGFVDSRGLSRGMGLFFLVFGLLPVPSLLTAVTAGTEGMHPVALMVGFVFMLIGLLAGFFFLNNWHETWVMMDSKQVQVRGRFGFKKTNKSWEFSQGGVVKPWVKCSAFTKLITCGLTIEGSGENFEIFSGDASALPRVMQLGPHLAQLLGIECEEFKPIPEVMIYSAPENRPEKFDATHFFEDLPEKGGQFFVAFGLLLSGCGFTDPGNWILMFMTQGPALVLIYFGLRLLRKFSQLKIDIEKRTLNYRWRNFFEQFTQEFPLDSMAAVLVTYFLSDNQGQSKYHVTLYFAEHAMPLFSVLSKDVSVQEVQERAWALSSQFGCPLIVAVNKSLEAAERLEMAAADRFKN